MLSSKTFKRHLRVIVISIVFTSAFRVCLLGRHTVELQRMAHQAAAQRSEDVESNWRSFTYADPSASNISERLVSLAIDGSPAVGLSSRQAAKLRIKFTQVMEYLRAPTFDRYYQLKASGLPYTFSLSTNAQRLLKRNGLRVDPGWQEKRVLALVWSAMLGTHSNNVPAITGISLTNVATVTLPSDSASVLLRSRASKGFTVAAEALNPGFLYAAGSHAEGSSETAFVLVSFFARANGSENAGPVYISFAWLPNSEQWAPSRFISDQWVGFRTLF